MCPKDDRSLNTLQDDIPCDIYIYVEDLISNFFLQFLTFG